MASSNRLPSYKICPVPLPLSHLSLFLCHTRGGQSKSSHKFVEQNSENKLQRQAFCIPFPRNKAEIKAEISTRLASMAPKKIPNKQATDRHPFLLSIEDVVSQLGTDLETGLSARRVAELKKEYPPNELDDGGGVNWTTILVRQVSNAMILVGLLGKETPLWSPRLTCIGAHLCHGPQFWR